MLNIFNVARVLVLVFFACALITSDAQEGMLENDPELLAAMELFMGMAPEEREETIKGLLDAVGDNPEQKAEMERLLELLPQMEAEQAKNRASDAEPSNIKQMIHDDELAKAKEDARRQLKGQDWETFWEDEAEILEATLASGVITPEDAERFKTDKKAWEQFLRKFYDDFTRSEL